MQSFLSMNSRLMDFQMFLNLSGSVCDVAWRNRVGGDDGVCTTCCVCDLHSKEGLCISWLGQKDPGFTDALNSIRGLHGANVSSYDRIINDRN